MIKKEMSISFTQNMLEFGPVTILVTQVKQDIPTSGYHINAFEQCGIVLRGNGLLERPNKTSKKLGSLQMFRISKDEAHQVSLTKGYLDLTIRVSR